MKTKELKIGQLYEWEGPHVLCAYLLNYKSPTKIIYIYKGEVLMYLGATTWLPLVEYKFKFLFGKTVCVLDRKECFLTKRCM